MRRLSVQCWPTGLRVNHVPKPALTSTARLRAWLAARKIRYWIGYQPASRYWLFQGVLAAILLGLAAAAGFTAVRLAGRRGSEPAIEPVDVVQVPVADDGAEPGRKIHVSIVR